MRITCIYTEQSYSEDDEGSRDEDSDSPESEAMDNTSAMVSFSDSQE